MCDPLQSMADVIDYEQNLSLMDGLKVLFLLPWQKDHGAAEPSVYFQNLFLVPLVRRLIGLPNLVCLRTLFCISKICFLHPSHSA